MQTEITMDELKTLGRIVGAVSGFIVGLVPVIVGYRYGKLAVGLGALVACVVGGTFAGLLVSLPIMAIALVFIVRTGSKKTTAIDESTDNLTAEPIANEPAEAANEQSN